MRFWLILFLSMCSLCVCAQGRYPCMGTTTTNLNVRSGPGTTYNILGTLQEDTTVRIMGESAGGWLLLDYYGSNGYIHPDYVELSAPIQQIQQKAPKIKRNWGIGRILITVVLSYIALLIFFNVINVNSTKCN